MDALALLRAERQRLKAEKAKANSEQTNQQQQNEVTKEKLPPVDTLFSQKLTLTPVAIPDIHPSLEGSVFYYPNFISKEEEAYILDSLYSPDSPPWVEVRLRRLKCFGGDPVPNALRTPLPEWLQRLARYVESSGAIDYMIDHCLVNEYLTGQTILPHTDGPSYHPCTACVSVGDATGVMTFTSKLKSEEIGIKQAETLLKLTLEPRSLVVFRGPAYTDALHGIDDVVVQGSVPRVSLTMRKILI